MTSLVSACSITGKVSITQAVMNAGMHVGVAGVLTARINDLNLLQDCVTKVFAPATC